MNPARRPMRRISNATGTADIATPMTSAVIGSVASSGDGASVCPTMPPASVTSGPPDAASACAAASTATLRQEGGEASPDTFLNDTGAGDQA